MKKNPAQNWCKKSIWIKSPIKLAGIFIFYLVYPHVTKKAFISIDTVLARVHGFMTFLHLFFSLVRLFFNFCPGRVFATIFISNTWFPGKSQGNGG